MLQNPEANIWSTYSNTRAWLNIHEALRNLQAQKPTTQKYKSLERKPRKLTEETLKEAIHRIETGESIRKVARELGVTHVALLKQLEKHLQACTEMHMVTGNLAFCSKQ
jgi:response regulator of citrate/malate metabolism